jgi:hypothetical protein
MCGIAEVLSGIVECGCNERNGTTEYPEHTEVREMGRVGPSGTDPYLMKMPPLRVGGSQEMGSS